MKISNPLLLLFVFAIQLALVESTLAGGGKPLVRLNTNLGEIELELDRDQAPVTVDNFLAYVKSGHYNGTIFHRVIKGFMIQGGGFNAGMEQKPTRAPIKNEADNGLKNRTGTIAMARTQDPHSASSQFFINTADNVSLDHYARSMQGWGYTVFGRVTRGMEVVRKIENTKTRPLGYFQDVPAKTVIINKAQLIDTGNK